MYGGIHFGMDNNIRPCLDPFTATSQAYSIQLCHLIVYWLAAKTPDNLSERQCSTRYSAILQGSYSSLALKHEVSLHPSGYTDLDINFYVPFSSLVPRRSVPITEHLGTTLQSLLSYCTLLFLYSSVIIIVNVVR